MGFIDSYKHLEKLCGDMLQTQHGVSAYIAEMESTPNGSYWVQGWVEDLKCLKHYRWVRNQIVHDPNSSEENMCDLSDAQWIDNFYDRIMKQGDPLAMYREATKPRPVAKPKPLRQSPQAQYTIFRTAGLLKKGSEESHWMGCVIDCYSTCRTVFCA